MKETDAQRNARRRIASWVTNKLNDTQNSAEARFMRDCVLRALGRINVNLLVLQTSVRDSMKLKTDEPLVCFYMKGGNAYKCIMEANARTRDGGGDSDWDTQILINPWAPEPVRKKLYAEIEELVLDEFKTCSDEIATGLHEGRVTIGVPGPTGIIAGAADDFAAARNLNTQYQTAIAAEYLADAIVHTEFLPAIRTTLGNIAAGHHMIKMDAEQTVRRIYDNEVIGLSFNDRLPLVAPVEGALTPCPGLMFNESIKPFSLYRLGYTFHVLDNDNERVLPKLALGELIDVTIPKIHTIEAVEVWEEMMVSGHITIAQIAVNVGSYAPVNLPLPSMQYHLAEMMLMLGEISDGSSHHMDKTHKRTRRMHNILDYTVPNPVGNAQAVFDALNTQMLCSAAGVSSEAELKTSTASIQSFTQLMNVRDATRNFTAGVNLRVKNFIVNQMEKSVVPQDGVIPVTFGHKAFNEYYVTKSLPSSKGYAKKLVLVIPKDDPGVKLSQLLLTVSKIKYGTTKLGEPSLLESGELALKERLESSCIISSNDISTTGIDCWKIIVCENDMNLNAIFGEISKGLLKIKDNLSRGIPVALTMSVKDYVRYDHRGILREKFIIIKDRSSQIIGVLNLVIGDSARSGGTHSMLNTADAHKIATLKDIGRQRKFAASLIHNYTLKTKVAKQLEVIQSLIDC